MIINIREKNQIWMNKIKGYAYVSTERIFKNKTTGNNDNK